MSFICQNGWTMGGWLPFTLPREMSAEFRFELKLEEEDKKWIFIALLQGMNGSGMSNPNPSVGCVIVKEGRQIASGHTEVFKARHAERVAMDSLPEMKDFNGCTAYVTLEPCFHQGHQPPCVDLLIEKKVSRVVIASTDPFPKVSGQGIRKLQQSGIEVRVGVLRQEALLWHLPFLSYHFLKRPFIVGKWAQSQNGLLADDEGKSKWITGPEARAYSHWLRQKYDAVGIGAGTVLKDSPKLTVRDCRAPIVRQPLRIVVDLRSRIGEITPTLEMTTFSKKTKTVLLISKGGKAPQNIPKHVLVAMSTTSDPVESVREFAASKEATDYFGKIIQSVYVEGGPALLGMFLEKQSFDALHVFTGEGYLSGKRYGVPFQRHEAGFTKVSENRLQSDLLQEYVKNSLLEKVLSS